MQPLSGGGFLDPPLFEPPTAGTRAAPAAATSGASVSDHVQLDGGARGGTDARAVGAPALAGGSPASAAGTAPSFALSSPRPWPQTAADLPSATAWPALTARGPADVAGGIALSGALGAALLPSLEGELKKCPRQPKSSWDGEPSAKGWRIPRNPSRTPVRPRDPFAVREGTDDLGPLEIVPSTEGRLRALRLQWPQEFQEPAWAAQQAVLHDVLTRLPSDVVVHIVTEGTSADTVRGLIAQWGVPSPQRVHMHPLQLHSTADQLYCPLTMWARDGAVLTRAEGSVTVLLLPRSFRGDTQVSPSLNRRVVQGTGAAPALLQTVLPELVVRRSRLVFEGGDLVASRRTLLVGADTIAQNAAALHVGAEEVVAMFAADLGREVWVVDPQPDFHIDLGFTFLDDDTVAVADPRETMRLLTLLAAQAWIPTSLETRERSAPRAVAFDPRARLVNLPAEALARNIRTTQERGVAERYDRAADALRLRGLRVVRLPHLCGLGLLTPSLTYNNVLMERYGDVRRVYLPSYGVPTLDEQAREVYRQHGFTVVDMPSARWSTLLWGAIRCATGELHITEN